jgi:quercetin dioxygenase-like cupin family protein
VLYVLKGRVAVHTEHYSPTILEVGDSIYLDSSIGHAYINAGEGEALAHVVCSELEPELDTALLTLLGGRGARGQDDAAG